MKKLFLLILGSLLIANVVLLNIQVSTLSRKLDQVNQTEQTMTPKPMDPLPSLPSGNGDKMPSISQVYDQVIDSVVTVLSYYQDRLLSTGSGVVYSNSGKDSYVVTNHHVINQATSYKLVLSDGQEKEATLVGSDVFADVAVLKVADTTLKPIKRGDSSKSRVGETVLAIGSPSGQNFSGSLSVGVLSGKDRTIPVDLDKDGQDDWDMVLLQTDAAINPGNSGGALVNMQGELIGINTLKIMGHSIEGLGFATPSNEVESIVDQLVSSGKVARPFVGISASAYYRRPNNPFLFSKLEPKMEPGILIAQVVKDSPADEAGLLPGDIILKFNDHDIDSFKTFRQYLYRCKPGDKIDLTVERNRELLTVTLTLK